MTRNIITKLAIPLAGLVLAGTAQAQEATLYLNAPVEGLAVSGSQLFWKAGCGRGFTSSIHSVPATIFTGGGHAFGGGLQGETIYEAPGCGIAPESIASRNIAVNDSHVFFIDSGRRLMRTPRRRGTPVRMTSVAAATFGGYSLAASPGWVAWSTGSTILRIDAGRPGAIPQPIVDPEELPAPILDLLSSGEGYIARAGNRLYRVIPPPRFSLTPVGGSENVTAFTVSGTNLYLAVQEPRSSYVIGVIGSDGAFRLLHAPGHSFERVDQIAVADGMIFWHIVVNDGAGPILRMPVNGGSGPAEITAKILLSSASRLSVSAGWLMWTRLEDRRLYRLPTSACARDMTGRCIVSP